jgi:hypothetical protein
MVLCRDVNVPKNGNIAPPFFAMLKISLVNAFSSRNHPHVYYVRDSQFLAWVTLWSLMWR